MSSIHQQSENNDWHKVAARILGSDRLPKSTVAESGRADVKKIGLEDILSCAAGIVVGSAENETSFVFGVCDKLPVEGHVAFIVGGASTSTNLGSDSINWVSSLGGNGIGVSCLGSGTLMMDIISGITDITEEDKIGSNSRGRAADARSEVECV